MIIKNSTGLWALFLSLPRWVDADAAGVPYALDTPRPDPTVCEATGRGHR